MLILEPKSLQTYLSQGGKKLVSMFHVCFFCKCLQFFRYKHESLKSFVSFYAKTILNTTSEVVLEATVVQVHLAVFSIIARSGEHLLLMLLHVFLTDCFSRLNGLHCTYQSLLCSPAVFYKYGPQKSILLVWHLSQPFRKFFQAILSTRPLSLHINIIIYDLYLFSL